MQSAFLPAPTMAPTRHPQGGMLERAGEDTVVYTSEGGMQLTLPYDATTDGGGWVTILHQAADAPRINPGATVVNEIAQKHGIGVVRYLVNGRLYGFYKRHSLNFNGFDLYANLAETWSSVSNDKGMFSMYSTYMDLHFNRNRWNNGLCVFNEEGKGFPNSCRAASSQPSTMWTEFHGPELPNDGGGQQTATIQLQVVRPPVSGAPLLSLAFNETAGSSVVADYSGNGFQVFPRTDTDILPTFNGRTVRLVSAYRQFLVIDSVLGHSLKRTQSYTVTASFNLASIGDVMRLFDFWDLGTSHNRRMRAQHAARIDPSHPAWTLIPHPLPPQVNGSGTHS